MTTKEGFQAMQKMLEPWIQQFYKENEFEKIEKVNESLKQDSTPIYQEDFDNAKGLLYERLEKFEEEEKEWLKKVDKRSLFIFFGMIIISLIIGLLVICIPAHAAFSSEGVNQWAQVFSNARGNPSADYERQRYQQMQQEQHELQMELLKEQIRQLKKQKNR